MINVEQDSGYTEDDFYTVIDKKCEDWIGTELEKYLRPDTLFRPANFESYLNQKISSVKKKSYSGISERLAEETERNINSRNEDGDSDFY